MKPTSRPLSLRILPTACLLLAGLAWGQSSGTGATSPAAKPADAATTPLTASPLSVAGGDTLDTSTPAPSGMAGAPDTARVAGAADSTAAESIAPEPTEGAFLVPIDGDVFYTANLKVLATLPTNPASIVLLLDGYPEAQPLTLSEGTVRADLAGLKSGVHELTLLLFNERTEIIGRQFVRFFVRVPEPKRKPRNGNVRQYGHVVAKFDWKNGEAQGRVLSQREMKLTSPTDSTLAAGKPEKPISQQYDGVAEGAYSVKYKQFEGYGKVLGRTDENRFRQPSDRIVANIKYGPWASLKAGDVYPLYNPLLLNGTRVRGAEAALNLTIGETTWGSLRAVRGASRREVPAYLVEYDTGNGTRIDTVPGTYAQTLTAVRLGIGGGPAFDMGFTVMKASDENGDGDHFLINSLLHGPRPAENLVPGIDLRIGAWDGRIQLYLNSALSLYTRDRSLGAFHPDSFDVAFNPQHYEDFFVFNSTTRGWQYLLSEKNGAESDVAGFLDASTALESGLVSSIPIGSMVEEFELRYSHLGLEYHSEGNPFLGGNPGDGFTAIEKLSVLDNRVSVAMELGQYGQDLGLTSQLQRTLKVDLRFTPGPYDPSFWIGGGRSNIVPEGTYAHQFSSSFLNFNTGAYHQFQLPNAKLHATVLYGFTESEYALRSAYPDDSLEDFPTTNTHIVNAMAQYKMRGLGFLPRLSYTFSSNGIQQPTHAVSMGFQQPLLDDRVKVDLSGSVGQYPKTNEVNDVSIGATADVEYVLGPQQSFRLREKFLHYGDRRHLLVGANYELFF
jgi:hypothetical protein